MALGLQGFFNSVPSYSPDYISVRWGCFSNWYLEGCEPRKSFLTPYVFIPLLPLTDEHRCGGGLCSKLHLVGMYEENCRKVNIFLTQK